MRHFQKIRLYLANSLAQNSNMDQVALRALKLSQTNKQINLCFQYHSMCSMFKPVSLTSNYLISLRDQKFREDVM